MAMKSKALVSKQRDDEARSQQAAPGAAGRGAETVALATATGALALGIARAGDEIERAERIAAERVQREAQTVETADHEPAATKTDVDAASAAAHAAPPPADDAQPRDAPSEETAEIALAMNAPSASDAHGDIPPPTTEGGPFAPDVASVQNAAQAEHVHGEAAADRGSGRTSIEIADSGLADAAEQITSGFSRVVAGLESGTIETDLAQKIADDIVSGIRDVMAQSGLARPGDLLETVAADLSGLSDNITDHVNDQLDAGGILELLRGPEGLVDVDAMDMAEGALEAAGDVAAMVGDIAGSVDLEGLTGDVADNIAKQLDGAGVSDPFDSTGELRDGPGIDFGEAANGDAVGDATAALGNIVEASGPSDIASTASSLPASVLGGPEEGGKGPLSDIFYDDGAGETVPASPPPEPVSSDDDGMIGEVSAAATSITEAPPNLPIGLIGQPLSDVEALGGMSNNSNPLHVF